MSVIVFGSINMDLITYVPRFPEVGETLFGYSFLTAPGGKGSNQAVAAARLGVPTRLFGRVGDDTFGPELMRSVSEQGVDLSGVMIDKEHGTGLAVISVDDNADNMITVVSGANMALDEGDVARCVAALPDAKVLVLQLEVPLEANIAVARAARELGVIVLLDPAPAKELPDEIFDLCDIITPNEAETEAQVGFRPKKVEEAAQAAEILLSRGVRTAIIKLGVGGVYYASSEDEGFVPSFVVDTIDTVAAGDAFNGGLATALAEGNSLAEAVRWGAAAGALATTRAGALPAMPRRDELEKLLIEGKTR